MDIVETPRVVPTGVGYVTAAVIVAWLAYVLVSGGLDPNGRNFLVLGAVRVVLFAMLLAFARQAMASNGLLGRTGLGLAGVAAAAYVAGAIGSVAADGWSFNPMGDDVAGEPPLYLIVMGLSANVFALGTLLVGIAGRGAGWPAAVVVVAGVLYPVVLFPLQPFGTTIGHAIWIGAYLAFAAGLIAHRAVAPADESRTAGARYA